VAFNVTGIAHNDKAIALVVQPQDLASIPKGTGVIPHITLAIAPKTGGGVESLLMLKGEVRTCCMWLVASRLM
jgi:hypothetical protein